MLLNSTLCTEKNIRDEWEARKLEAGQPFNHVNYETMNDEQRTAFSLLMDYGLISIVAKGVQSLKCFEAISHEGEKFLKDMAQYSKTGLVKVITKKSGKNINSLILELWKHCVEGDIKMKSAPNKAIFYTTKQELDDALIDQMLTDQENKKESRVQAFEQFTTGIEAGRTAEELVKEALDI